MNLIHSGEPPAAPPGETRISAGAHERALLLEREGVVRERAQRLLEADGLAVCATASPELFQQLAHQPGFDWIIVGTLRAEELSSLKLECFERLILLVPGAEPSHLRAYRLGWPDAFLIDRRLEHPDGFRAALALSTHSPSQPTQPGGAADDPVREAFEPFGLSERQLEVLRAALLGVAPDAIGRELFISERTVRNHLHAIYQATGTSGRRELLGRFVRALLG